MPSGSTATDTISPPKVVDYNPNFWNSLKETKPEHDDRQFFVKRTTSGINLADGISTFCYSKGAQRVPPPRVDSLIEKPSDYEGQGIPNKVYLQKVLSDLHTKINNQEPLVTTSMSLLRHGHSDQFSYSSLNQGPPGKSQGSSMLAAYPSEPYHSLISQQRGRVNYVKIDRSVLGKTSTDMRKQPKPHSLREVRRYLEERQRSVHPNNRPLGLPLIEPGSVITHLLQ